MKLNLFVERVNRGKTIREMAGEIGVPDHVYRRVEKTGQMPAEANAYTIAQYFGMSVAELWELEAA
jgi:DNA-binding XRE family transcriptional regulator